MVRVEEQHLFARCALTVNKNLPLTLRTRGCRSGAPERETLACVDEILLVQQAEEHVALEQQHGIRQMAFVASASEETDERPQCRRAVDTSTCSTRTVRVVPSVATNNSSSLLCQMRSDWVQSRVGEESPAARCQLSLVCRSIPALSLRCPQSERIRRSLWP